MTVVHEEMHQRAGQQEQIRKCAQKMGLMLGQQVKERNSGKYPPGQA